MNKVIDEQGMLFIAENTFHIEKSTQYKNLPHGIKTVEFVRAKGNYLLFIEAKSSFANPANAQTKESFQEEIADVFDKFYHSLSLYSAIDIGVIKEGFPDDYKPASKVLLLLRKQTVANI
jgi:hypothetical protein